MSIEPAHKTRPPSKVHRHPRLATRRLSKRCAFCRGFEESLDWSAVDQQVMVDFADLPRRPSVCSCQFLNPVSTGLQSEFQVNSPNYDFRYADYPGIGYDSYHYLTFGGQTGTPNDDWEVVFGGGGVYAFGCYVLDNRGDSGESWEVFDTLGGSLGSMTPPAGTSPTLHFIGVACDSAIGRVVFDEDPGNDDIAIADFALVVPGPATMALLAVAGPLPRRGRRRL